jgi:hypothetical protein
VQASLLGGRFRTIVGRARLGGNDDPFLAVVPRGPEEAPDDPPFWVGSWQAHYRELDAAHDLTSADELDEVAYQVGLQLGRGHIRQFATPFDHQLRRAVRDMLRDYGPRIRATIASMTATRPHARHDRSFARSLVVPFRAQHFLLRSDEGMRASRG